MIIHYKTAWSNFNVPAMQEEESINKYYGHTITKQLQP